MKASCHLFACAYAIFALASPVSAQSPREQLNQLTAQLRTNPSDSALRERIVKLAQEIKPPPALPEEAERRMARGTAAFKSAKSENDFKDAVRELEQAALAAPWSGDVYFNLGLAQDRAGDYASAIRSLKLAMLAAPDSRETKTLLYEVEYRQEKVNSPEAQLAKKRAQGDELLKAVDGAMFRGAEPTGRTVTVEVRGRTAIFTGHRFRGQHFELWPINGNCQLSAVDGKLMCEVTLSGSTSRMFIDIATHGRSVWTAWIEPDGKKSPPTILERVN